MKQKLTAFFIVLALLLSLMGSAAAAHAYSDTAELAPWAKEAVDFVDSRGLMNGIGSNLFGPEETASRAMVVTVIWRMAGSPIGNLTGVFSDVPIGEWYSDAIDWAAEEGIVVGEKGKFNPFDPITRQDLLLILYRYGGSPASDVSILSYFYDYTQVSGYAANALAWAAQSGIANGDGINLMPKESATRAQLAAIVMRYLKLTGQDPGELPPDPTEPTEPLEPTGPDMLFPTEEENGARESGTEEESGAEDDRAEGEGTTSTPVLTPVPQS